MAKVVTSKFGERQLVQLPPVNFSGSSRSAEVRSIVPYNHQDNRGDYTNRSSSSSKNGQYGSMQTPQRMQATVRPEGNLVTDMNNLGGGFNVAQPNNVGPGLHYTPYAMGQQQQYQPQFQPSQQQYQSQDQPPQQQFQPHDQPHQQQNQPQPYTQQNQSTHRSPQEQNQPYADAQQYQQQPPVHSDTGHSHHSGGAKEKHIYYGPNGEVLPGPPPGVSMPASGNNQNEKHIYYGPNGEVLPGPPQGPQMAGPRLQAEPQTDFVVEGVLNRGRLVTLYSVDNQGHFPILPDYVLRTLMEKYSQFEITDVRIAYRWKEYNIHGVPRLQAAKERLIAIPQQQQQVNVKHKALPPPPPKQPEEPQTIIEDATEEIVEYIYPGDEGYEEAKRELEHREAVGDRDKDRPVTVKSDGRRERLYYTHSVPDREYRGDRYYTRSIHHGDRGYRRTDYHTHDRPWWDARQGPEDESYRRHYHGSYTAPDDADYRRRAYTAKDDPLDGLRWKKERATIAETKPYTGDKKYTY